VDRLRPKLNAVSGARLFLQAAQDLRIGGRQSAAEYQYTLTSDDPDTLFTWVPKLVAALGKERLSDVNSDLQQHGLQIFVNFDRATAARYGFAPNQIDTGLYDAFGQRTVSTVYNELNQYYVVMEVAPSYWQYPQMLERMRFSPSAGNASGTQQTQMSSSLVKGVTTTTVASTTSGTSTSTNAKNADAEANLLTNAISNAKGGGSSGSADSTAAETLVPFPAIASYVSNHTATQVSHQAHTSRVPGMLFSDSVCGGVRGSLAATMSSTTCLGYQRLTTGTSQQPSTQPRVKRCWPRQNISAFHRTRQSQTMKTAAAANSASAEMMPSEPEIRSASSSLSGSAPYVLSVWYEYQSDHAVAHAVTVTSPIRIDALTPMGRSELNHRSSGTCDAGMDHT